MSTVVPGVTVFQDLISSVGVSQTVTLIAPFSKKHYFDNDMTLACGSSAAPNRIYWWNCVAAGS